MLHRTCRHMWLVIVAAAAAAWLAAASALGDDVKAAAKNDAATPSGSSPHRTERAVSAALDWLANHQSLDGRWSLGNFCERCRDKSCTGQVSRQEDVAATAMGLLPFLAAGQTHKSAGSYRGEVSRGLDWLFDHQRPDGSIAMGTSCFMYENGMATIALCEAYGMSGDVRLGEAAQKAVDFIVKVQNKSDGGWRYFPCKEGDTSVFGWQLSALTTAKKAGLKVPAETFARAGKFLDSVAVNGGSEYKYCAFYDEPQASTTAIGLLGRQYLGARNDDKMLVGGAKYLLSHLPDERQRNCYYWYYGTQVMRNSSGDDWDAWNRKLRDILLRTQVAGPSCAAGSWDPNTDMYGSAGGRVMETAFSTMMLEASCGYGYHPVFRTSESSDGGTSPKEKVAAGEAKPKVRAVTAALIWLANHQSYDGSWSLQRYTIRCRDKSCTGPGSMKADAGATALGILPFLAAGQTHRAKGPFQKNIGGGIAWLMRQQQPDGNLAKGAQEMMYSHGLATVALSEAYGLTADPPVREAAQKAVDFIVAAQNKTDGGWRYNPGDPGDTSVLGWQLLALKSAHMAGLKVPAEAFKGAGKFLDTVAVNHGAEYAYTPGSGAAETMTAVGLLGRQFLGAKRDDKMLVGGEKYLMAHLPDAAHQNVYYWFYGTQVMHGMNDQDWDLWNRKLRELLVRTQIRDSSCANGSWDPANDPWGKCGGRLMTTSLSALSLEIYYRYLPLFKAEPAPAD